MQERVNLWLDNDNVFESEKEIIKTLSKDELDEAFYRDLEFGTAGMRGIMGVGTNRINIHTISMASVGYAKYINDNKVNQKVAIAYDNRNNSKLYAEVAAKVLAAHNIEVLLFKELMPTPLLSYAVRELNCGGGIVITASHNPKEYNGFKVYDERGCQLVPELIDQVVNHIDNIDNYLNIDLNLTTKQEKLISVLDDSLKNQYIETILKFQMNFNTNDDFKVVYSSQHGTGIKVLPEVLEKANYNYYIVESQAIVDGNFTNTLSPNPENPDAYVEAIKLAKEKSANLVITTDPDADRVGVAILHNNNYVLLNGNETTVIILYYILNEYKKANKLSSDSIVMNTIVTSDLGEKIAAGFNVKTAQTLTGFKYIGTLMDKDNNLENFVYGYEESYGSLPFPIVRDKDAITASLLLCEIASYFSQKNMTLVDLLDKIHQEYGYYKEGQLIVRLQGLDGEMKMKSTMNAFYEAKLGKVDNYQIVKTENYNTSLRITEAGETKIDLDQSDVMKIYFKDLGWIAVRPSGTEPLIKIYVCAQGQDEKEVISNYQQLEAYVKDRQM